MQILTKRLLLRPWSLNDLPDLISLNSDPDVYNWLGGPALVNRSEEALQRYIDNFNKYGWGIYYIQELAGEFFGLAGLQPLRSHFPLVPGLEGVWRFLRRAWGHGYASAAMSAILKADHGYGISSDIVAVIAEANVRSIKTAERIGFKYDSRLDFLHPDLEAGHPLRLHKVFRYA